MEENKNNQTNNFETHETQQEPNFIMNQQNESVKEDTTYHRNYRTNPDPNARTYSNGQTGGSQQQTPPFYASYNPNGSQDTNQQTYQSGNATAQQNPYQGYQNQNTQANGYQSQTTQTNGYQTQNTQYQMGAGQTNYQKPKKTRVKKEHKNLKFFGKAFAFGAIAGCIMFGIVFSGNKLLLNKSTETATTSASSSTAGTVTTSNASSTTVKGSVAEIVKNDMPSIVSITSTFSGTNGANNNDFFYWFYGGNNSSSREKTGSGSGVIISETDDQFMIVTNNHVISDSSYGDATKVQVTFSDDKVVDATVKGTDADADLAVLTVKKADMKKETLDTVKVAVLGDSDALNVGDEVVAIGNALGYGQSVTSGIISAKNREVQLEDKTMTLLQTDAAINPGNSGGALLNMSGELVGINSVKYASDSVEGMGYAIPMDIAKPIIEDLMNEKKVAAKDAAYLGIYGNDVSSDLSSAYDMPEGVWVSKVVSNSPAAKAGIQQRDIIVKFNDRKISSMKALQEQIAKKSAGTKVTITVQRQNSNGEYKEQKISVNLEKKPSSMENDSNSTNQNSNRSQQGNQSRNGSQSNDDMQQFFNDFFGN